MTIYFATDHAGYEMKEALLPYVRDILGYDVFDLGAYELDSEDDYPTYIKKAGEAVSKNPLDAKAIIFGGSGQGEAIVANKFPSVRAIVYYGGNLDIVKLSREHNDANVLSLGARFLDLEAAKEAVELWLETNTSTDPKYARRNQALDQ